MVILILGDNCVELGTLTYRSDQISLTRRAQIESIWSEWRTSCGGRGDLAKDLVDEFS
jgi:hypothetical protein